jgi:hypothetical protein
MGQRSLAKQYRTGSRDRLGALHALTEPSARDGCTCSCHSDYITCKCLRQLAAHMPLEVVVDTLHTYSWSRLMTTPCNVRPYGLVPFWLLSESSVQNGQARNWRVRAISAGAAQLQTMPLRAVNRSNEATIPPTRLRDTTRLLRSIFDHLLLNRMKQYFHPSGS